MFMKLIFKNILNAPITYVADKKDIYTKNDLSNQNEKEHI